MTRERLGILKQKYICQVPELEQLNLNTVAVKNGLSVHITDQFLEVDGPYGTDFCSPKWVVFGKVFGTSDGKKLSTLEKNARAMPVFRFTVDEYGYRELTKAAFLHDVLCFFLDEIARQSGESKAEIRYLTDCVFHRESLGFRWRELYYKGLRVYGRLKYGKR